jgi:uncharacterized protein Veg
MYSHYKMMHKPCNSVRIFAAGDGNNNSKGGLCKAVADMPEEKIVSIRNEIIDSKGQYVVISSRSGRRGTICKKGILENVYPDVFVVSVDEDGYSKKYCYAYSDILTHTIEINIVN